MRSGRIHTKPRPCNWRRIDALGVGESRVYPNNLGSIWDRSGIDLGSIQDRSGIDLGSIWDRSGIDLGSIWDRSGIDLGSIWDRSGVDIESIWDRSRIDLGSRSGINPRSIRDRYGVDLGSIWGRSGADLVSIWTSWAAELILPPFCQGGREGGGINQHRRLRASEFPGTGRRHKPVGFRISAQNHQNTQNEQSMQGRRNTSLCGNRSREYRYRNRRR